MVAETAAMSKIPRMLEMMLGCDGEEVSVVNAAGDQDSACKTNSLFGPTLKL